MNNKKPWYISSADATKLSLTVKGLLVSVIPFAIVILNALGVGVGEGDLNEAINAVERGIVAVGTIGSGVMVLVGLGRKIYYRLMRK